MTEIEAILCKLLHCDRSSLYVASPRQKVSPQVCGELERILKKRLSGEPLQYLLGGVDFMGWYLKVKPGVFIPRPETEALTHEACEVIRASGIREPRILDLGSGCGNIAIALAGAFPLSQVLGVDISDIALKTARANARRHGMTRRVRFCHSDLFEVFKAAPKTFDFIISNPPYISPTFAQALPEDVKREPPTALFAEEEGLSFYPRIEEGARSYLKKGGWLFLEIGAEQGPAIERIFSDRGSWKDLRLIRDDCDRHRVAVVQRV